MDPAIVIDKLHKAGYSPSYATKKYVAFTAPGRPTFKVVYSEPTLGQRKN